MTQAASTHLLINLKSRFVDYDGQRSVMEDAISNKYLLLLWYWEEEGSHPPGQSCFLGDGGGTIISITSLFIYIITGVGRQDRQATFKANVWQKQSLRIQYTLYTYPGIF